MGRRNVAPAVEEIVDECGKNLDATGQIDFNAVKKQVIRSQPPRVADIPDLVEYCRVWGGLPTGVFVDELSTLCAALPSDRIVSGSFLKWMANLKNAFPTRDLPSHFVNAVTYAHAQASEGIVDGFSRFITRGEVASIGSKENATQCSKLKLCCVVDVCWLRHKISKFRTHGDSSSLRN